jgi:hypothetical protein
MLLLNGVFKTRFVMWLICIYLKKKPKQFDIYCYCKLFYFQSLTQLKIISIKFQNKWVPSCNDFNNVGKYKFDSFCVDCNVQLPSLTLLFMIGC